MKKILLFKKEMSTNGCLEKQTLRLLDLFHQKGHPVTLISATPFLWPKKFENLSGLPRLLRSLAKTLFCMPACAGMTI